MFLRQYIASLILSTVLFFLTIRLVQKGRLDIAYCWIWLGISLGAVLVVVRYSWLEWLSRVIGALTPTTTLFLMGFFVILLMCMQFSLVISQQRRQIKKLSQQLALLTPQSAQRTPENA
jgi:bacteriorhodopsin